MKRNLPSPKMPLPKLASDSAAAEYFETHSVADMWDQLPDAKPLKLSKALAKKIRERSAVAKSPISIRLGADHSDIPVR
jgi:hypothetical protein